MRAGDLRHPGTFQRSSIARDSVGGETQTWVTYESGWFEILPLSGKEFIAAQQANAEVTHTIRGRWIDGVKPSDRLLIEGRTFDILAAMNWGERNRELRIMAKEIV